MMPWRWLIACSHCASLLTPIHLTNVWGEIMETKFCKGHNTNHPATDFRPKRNHCRTYETEQRNNKGKNKMQAQAKPKKEPVKFVVVSNIPLPPKTRMGWVYKWPWLSTLEIGQAVYIGEDKKEITSIKNAANLYGKNSGKTFAFRHWEGTQG